MNVKELFSDLRTVLLVGSPLWIAGASGLSMGAAQLHRSNEMHTRIESCITAVTGPERPAPYSVAEGCRIKTAGPNADAFRPQFTSYAHS